LRLNRVASGLIVDHFFSISALVPLVMRRLSERRVIAAQMPVQLFWRTSAASLSVEQTLP